MTASLVVGSLHPNGEIIPRYLLEVREGSRISLILHPLTDDDKLTRLWEVPGPSQLAVCVMALVAIAGDRVPAHHLRNREYVNSEDLSKHELDELSFATVSWKQLALVITLTSASSLRADAFANLSLADIQICVEVYRRQWSQWRAEWLVESQVIDGSKVLMESAEGTNW